MNQFFCLMKHIQDRILKITAANNSEIILFKSCISNTPYLKFNFKNVAFLIDGF